MSKFLLHILLALSIVTFLVSCERRPLVDFESRVKVRVVLDTKNILNVTTGIYNDKVKASLPIPSTFRVIFYNKDTKQLASQAFITRKGLDDEGYDYYEGEVYINPGSYDLVCYNFDTPTTLVREEKDKNTIEAFTPEISDRLYTRFQSRLDYLSPKIYYEPDHLFVAREDGISIPDTKEVISITTRARTVVDTYYVQIRVVNGKYASNVVAMLTDLAPSTRFGVNEPKYTEYAGTYFEMYHSVDQRARLAEQDILCAVFNTFGKRPDHIDPMVESQLYLAFSVVTTDGQNLELAIDMDEIFQTPEAKENHWLFIDKEIVLPKPDDGAFKPSVEEWNEVVGEIEIEHK